MLLLIHFYCKLQFARMQVENKEKAEKDLQPPRNENKKAPNRFGRALFVPCRSIGLSSLLSARLRIPAHVPGTPEADPLPSCADALHTPPPSLLFLAASRSGSLSGSSMPPLPFLPSVPLLSTPIRRRLRQLPYCRFRFSR